MDDNLSEAVAEDLLSSGQAMSHIRKGLAEQSILPASLKSMIEVSAHLRGCCASYSWQEETLPLEFVYLLPRGTRAAVCATVAARRSAAQQQQLQQQQQDQMDNEDNEPTPAQSNAALHAAVRALVQRGEKLKKIGRDAQKLEDGGREMASSAALLRQKYQAEAQDGVFS